MFTSDAGSVFGDANGDGQVNGTDLIFIRNDLGTSEAASDLDGNGTVEDADLVLCRNALGTDPDTLTVYAEGLTASTTLCDVMVDLLTDPDQDTVFTSAGIRQLTSVSIDLTPTSGAIGVPISITMQPAIAPIIFDNSTTARWQGVYEPLVGPATGMFEIEYNPSQFRESSGSVAEIIIGNGTN